MTLNFRIYLMEPLSFGPWNIVQPLSSGFWMDLPTHLQVAIDHIRLLYLFGWMLSCLVTRTVQFDMKYFWHLTVMVFILPKSNIL